MDPQSQMAYSRSVELLRQKRRTGLVTLLFTDMVESTALKRQLGDRPAAEFFKEHHAVIRATLATIPQGEEIETAGDSFLLLFSAPSDAVRFAITVQQQLRQLAQQLNLMALDRIGIHVGEVVVGNEADGLSRKDVFGIQIDTCARVLSLARAGQVLMTRAVFDNARQVLKGEDIAGVSALDWLNHGTYLLKGLEDPVEICEVREPGADTGGPPGNSEKGLRQVRPDEEPVLGWRPAIGELVPNTQWVLEKKLGEGGFGEVWLGRHQRLREGRVFKFCFRADRVRSLKREMTLFRVLKERVGDHPNIVRLLEVYLEQPPFYLMMDQVEGEDLKCWFEKQRGADVPLRIKLEIVAQIADALQAAHDAGVIHRDVKPSNIIVQSATPPSPTRPGGERDGPVAPTGFHRPLAKLTDFGIGQVLSEEALQGVTRTGFTETIVGHGSSSQTGSQMYMAPEILAGKPASIRSDIYSLGVVLYQLLVGDLTRPLTTDWEASVDHALLREDLKRCFAGNPQERFAGAGQLAEHLRSLEHREAARRARENSERAGRRRRRAVAMASASSFLLLLLSAAMGYGLRRAWQSERELRRLLYVADMNVAELALREGNRGLALGLLKQYRNPPAGQDLRGFEWRHLWSLCQSKEQFSLPGQSNRVTALAFSPDGKVLYSGGSDGALRAWDLATRTQLAAQQLGNEWIEAMTVSPMGGTVLVGWPTGVALLDGHSLALEARLRGARSPLALSPGGETLLSRGTNGLMVWDPIGRELLQTLSHVTNGAFAFSPDGQTIAVAESTADRIQLKLWPTASVRAQGELAQPRLLWQRQSEDFGFPSQLAFTGDGRWLAIGYDRDGLQVWDLQSGKRLGQVTGRTRRLAFHPNGHTLVTQSGSQNFRVWDIASTNGIVPVGSVHGHLNEMWALATTVDGQTLASGGKDGSLKVWSADVIAAAAAAKHEVEVAKAGPFSFSRDGRRLVTVSSNAFLRIWDTTTLQALATHLLPANVRLAMPSPTADRLALGLTNGAVQLWDFGEQNAPHFQRELLPASTNAAEPLFAPRSGLESVFPLMTWSADGQHLAVVLDAIYVCDTRTGPPRKLPLRARPISIALSGDGQFLAAGLDSSARVRGPLAAGIAQEVHLWDLRTGKVSVCAGHKDTTCDLRFSLDGHVLATASLDNNVGLWSVPTGASLGFLTNHALGVFHLAFAPDGRTLATQGGGGALKLWNLETHRELMTFHLASDSAEPLGFSPDGRVLAVGEQSPPRIKFFRAQTREEIQMSVD